MHRRNFLKNTSLAGLTLTAVLSSSCHAPAGDKKEDEAVVANTDEQFELSEITIDTLQEKNDGRYLYVALGYRIIFETH
jgi:amidase